MVLGVLGVGEVGVIETLLLSIPLQLSPLRDLVAVR